MSRPTRRAEVGYTARPRGCRFIWILVIGFRHALIALDSFVVVLVLVVLIMQLGTTNLCGRYERRSGRPAKVSYNTGDITISIILERDHDDDTIDIIEASACEI